MSSSFTRFHEHGFWARDGMLEPWLRCLALNLDAGSYPVDHWLHAFRDHLLIASSGIFNGCISAGLDEHLTCEDRIVGAVSASERTIQHLRSFGGEIPASFLNSLGIENGAFEQGLPLAWFEDLHVTFTSLLLGRLDSDVVTSRVLPSL